MHRPALTNMKPETWNLKPSRSIIHSFPSLPTLPKRNSNGNQPTCYQSMIYVEPPLKTSWRSNTTR